MIILIVVGIFLFIYYKILNKRYTTNYYAAKILNAILSYLSVIFIVFILDIYNIPSSILKYNIDYQLWLDIIINSATTLIFSFAIVLLIESFHKSIDRNLKMDEFYNINCELISSKILNTKVEFDIKISANKLIKVFGYGFEDVKEKRTISRKAKIQQIKIMTSKYKPKDIDIYIIIDNKKCKITLTIKRAKKEYKLEKYFCDFEYINDFKN